jgi:hypothetical protein
MRFGCAVYDSPPCECLCGTFPLAFGNENAASEVFFIKLGLVTLAGMLITGLRKRKLQKNCCGVSEIETHCLGIAGRRGLETPNKFLLILTVSASCFETGITCAILPQIWSDETDPLLTQLITL